MQKSDVDLVVFINQVKTVKDLELKLDLILDILRSHLDSRWGGYAGPLKCERQTSHGLQYKLSCSDSNHFHDVDILPACDILKGIPDI